jgi:uncharacterized protein YdcH (DUF465 family)
MIARDRDDCPGADRGVSLDHGGRVGNTEVAKQALLAELTAEHRRLDQQLQQLERRRALSPTEQAEIARLKKQKLLTKDRITRLA